VVPAPSFEGERLFAAKKKQIQKKKTKLTKFLSEMDGNLLPKDPSFPSRFVVSFMED